MAFQLEEEVSLAALTTLGVGGPARWLTRISSEDELVESLRWADSRGVPVFVLGGGSNLLVRDAGFPGLVVRMEMPGLEYSGGMVKAGAGLPWEDLVEFSTAHDLQGIECLAGIPGTVGGTPVQNVGAYGQEVSQTIQMVRCFDRRERAFVEFTGQECGFEYRTSRFNGVDRERFVVTRVDFALIPCGAPTLRYADLVRRFPDESRPGLGEVAAAVREIRRGKGMVVDAADPDSRSAGSFFRNPVITRERFALLLGQQCLREADVPHWTAGDGVKLAAAWLLERAGFVRGYAMGRAGISSRHTLALVNRGGATADEVVSLRNRIVAGVWERFGIELEQEPVTVG